MTDQSTCDGEESSTTPRLLQTTSFSWREIFIASSEERQSLFHWQCIQCSAFFSPLVVVLFCIVILVKGISPVSLCGTSTTFASLLFHKQQWSSCHIISWSSVLNAAILLSVVSLLSYVIAIAYVNGQKLIIHILCGALYSVPILFFLLIISVRFSFSLGIETVDVFSFVYIMWSITGSLIFIIFFADLVISSQDKTIQKWRNFSLIMVAIAASYCFLLLSEGALYFFMISMTLWDILAVYWPWGPIYIMLNFQKKQQNWIVTEQPGLLKEVELLRRAAFTRQRQIISGEEPRKVDDILQDMEQRVGVNSLSGPELPSGLSYTFRAEAKGTDDMSSCSLGVMDFVLLGVVVGLAGKRTGLAAVSGCIIAALLGSSAATLHSIRGDRTVPALPAALGLCLVVYVFCSHIVPLQTFIDSVNQNSIYF